MTLPSDKIHPDAVETPQVHPFESRHFDGALALSQAEGWPHRLEDWQLTQAVSEGVVALIDDKVVGTAMCSIFGDVAMLNMIIVDSKLRGLGLGRKLMEAVITRAGAREMRLVATEAGRPLYEKLGFVTTGKIDQYQGVAQPLSEADQQAFGLGSIAVTTGSTADLERIVAMDRAATGLERRALLSRIMAQGEVFLAEGGFALIRDFGRGRVLGPVVAEEAVVARALIAEAAKRYAGQFLRVDVPAGCALGPVAEALGLSPVGDGTAMTRAGQDRPHTQYTTYALVSQALG